MSETTPEGLARLREREWHLNVGAVNPRAKGYASVEEV